MPENTILIYFNKKKLILLSLLCFLFIALGFCFAIIPAYFSNGFIKNPIIIRMLGFFSLVLFGFYLGSFLPRIKGKQVGIIIDDQGITDQVSNQPVGLVPWNHILSISIKRISRQRFLFIDLSDEATFLNELLNKKVKKEVALNKRVYGVPIALPLGFLKYDTQKLEHDLTSAWDRNKKVFQ